MVDAPLLDFSELCVSRALDGAPILTDVSLVIEAGKTAVLLAEDQAHSEPAEDATAGIAAALLGSDRYPVTGGAILLAGDNISGWVTNVRAAAGLFCAMAGPAEPSGISNLALIQMAAAAHQDDGLGVTELRQILYSWLDRLDLDRSLLMADIGNPGSPSEALGAALIQALACSPTLLVVDVPAFGENEEVFETLAAGLALARLEQPTLGALIMSRDDRLFDHLKPDDIHVLSGGRIATSDGLELAGNGTTDGYESLT